MTLTKNKKVAEIIGLSGLSSADAAGQLAKKMSEINLKQKEQETAAKAQVLGLPYINLKGFGISPNTLSLLTLQTAQEKKVIVFLYTEHEFRLGAVEDTPAAREVLAALEEELHAHGVLYLISENSFNSALKLYEALPKIKQVVRGVQITESDLQKFTDEVMGFKQLAEQINKVARNSLSDVVNLIISGALKARASDIHIEAGENQVKIRYRIDGILTDITTLPKEDWSKIISRLKLLAGLKINITDRPQDGRFSIFLTGEKIDVRVSALPTQFGESLVIRLLMSTVQGVSFDNLGLSGQAYNNLLAEITKPTGIVISTGPTGAGKTTTLYAILNKLNQSDIKIITIEDPIEYQLPNVSQSQVDADAGYTFAKGLRYIVRQDPDILMVGEIRDLETAEIAVQAALTGHAVFSTLHTNDAAGAIPRLLSLGVKAYLLAPALNAIVGQRLVRKLCPDCKKETKLEASLLDKVKKNLTNLPADPERKLNLTNLKFSVGTGCTTCQHLGYLGRIGIFEVLVVDDEIEKVVLSAETSDAVLRDIAIKKGMLTMLQDGLVKAAQGITTVEEVFRVVSE